VEPEFSVNLMKRHNSRKFKTPSFKWKKKKKQPASAPEPSAPLLTPDNTLDNNDSIDIDPDSNLDFEDKQMELFEKKISLDSLTDQLQQKEQDMTATAVANEADTERMKQDVAFFQDRLRETEEMLNRVKTDNAMLHQRCELAERDRGAMQHGSYMEIEKVRADYQSKIDELAQYPEKLSSAEARYQDAESNAARLQTQLAERNATVQDLNRKIDTFQEQISLLKQKFHAVNEDNIELSNKTQSHERKVMEADLHNKNLMDLVSKKDETVEQHQPSLTEVDSKLSALPLPPTSPPSPPSVSDNNASEEEKKKAESETETESTSSEEEVDWSEMLKSVKRTGTVSVWTT